MPRSSPAAYELTRASLNRLPEDRTFRRGEPRYSAVEEIFWACWAAIAEQTLSGSEFPDCIVFEPIEGTIAVPRETWSDFFRETELNHDDVRERFARVLGEQFSVSTAAQGATGSREIPLPPHVGGILIILCRFRQQELRGERARFLFDEEVVKETIARHPNPASFGPVDPSELVRAVTAYAALPPRTRDSVLRTAYFFGYRTLSHRCARLRYVPPARPTLSANLLLETTVADAEDRAENAIAKSLDSLEAPTLGKERSATPVMAFDVLSDLLDSLLRSEVDLADPRDESIRRHVGQALERFLSRNNVETLGSLGAEIRVHLPHPAWRLDYRIAQSHVEGESIYCVQRRGLKVGDCVLLPALIVPAETADG